MNLSKTKVKFLTESKANNSSLKTEMS